MRFVPAVSLVAPGAKAHFVNNDPWDHHVRASAAGVSQFDAGPAGGFELMISGKPEGKPGKTADASFDKPGAVLLGCHLHSSMRGHVYVSDSPWAALTGTDGLATLDVPDGAASIKVWHADQLIDIAPLQVDAGRRARRRPRSSSTWFRGASGSERQGAAGRSRPPSSSTSMRAHPLRRAAPEM